MSCRIDFEKLTPVDLITGDDVVETEELHAMLARAGAYLRSFGWCPPIAEQYLGIGIGGVLALFLFKLERPIGDTDQWLWVVVGDVPSAYYVIDEACDPASALEVYCQLMEEWAEVVSNKLPLDTVFPVDAPATLEYAQMLQSRVKFIRERILPTFLR